MTNTKSKQNDSTKDQKTGSSCWGSESMASMMQNCCSENDCVCDCKGMMQKMFDKPK